ncbi:HemK2/MTQ2 family protein methyltransferase [Halorientalis litorea]|jgi:release factor glutamine methyltransferase|uniref:HemK2/MTQ2 family protein methyltransferase n=1 Tax=Halorientalis litorea TaxID=2931977 RepID=UPI001FF14F7F|nr:HemK2/MTQ2 family protein methyltransferase [Halorientalis litorea]
MTDLAERRGMDDDVYGPAEDTRLLAEATRDAVTTGDRVLDVGTGSGFVAEVARDAGARVVGSDVNPHACRAARERGIPVVRGNLTAPFRAGTFDFVLFNPPYLPTPPEETGDDWMAKALSGGESGRAVVTPFLDDVGRVLAPDGAVLLLVSSLTGLDEVRDTANENGLVAEEVASEKYPFERLVALRLITTNHQTD